MTLVYRTPLGGYNPDKDVYTYIYLCAVGGKKIILLFHWAISVRSSYAHRIPIIYYFLKISVLEKNRSIPMMDDILTLKSMVLQVSRLTLLVDSCFWLFGIGYFLRLLGQLEFNWMYPNYLYLISVKLTFNPIEF